METAIKKAIEGGWNDRLYRVDTGNDKVWTHHSSLLLDPLFWQALGKSMGWKTYTWTSWKGWDDHSIEYPTDDQSYNPPSENAYCQRHITPILHWHRFIDHLASGQSADSFFEELLSDKK